MLKVKHLVHPLRTAQTAKMRALAHLRMRRFASHSNRHFRADSRYDLQNVTNGFLPRFADSCNNHTSLLHRICNAYRKAVADQRFAPSCYGPTEWWNELRHNCLGPVMRALQDGNIAALQGMYKNFFRDPCAAGLVGLPFGMWKGYFRSPIQDVYRRSYLGDSLYRLDHWTSRTNGSFRLADLKGPDIGNPFGVLINGTLVRSGAAYQHYCAHRVLTLSSGRRVVADIGGGYGGLAYYLLRDASGLTYLNFDLPESIALASYYLLNAFPSLRFALYGEKPLNQETVASSDVVLMPVFEMRKLREIGVHVTVSSHAMSDLSPSALAGYMNVIVPSTQNYFLYVGKSATADAISSFLRQNYNFLGPWEMQASGWNRHIAPDAREVECIYRFTRN